MAHQSRFLPSGHPERGDAGNVRAAVANAAMQMEARVLETLRLKRSSEEGDETKTGDEKKKKRRFRRPSKSQG
jgi:heat shock protein HslJ